MCLDTLCARDEVTDGNRDLGACSPGVPVKVPFGRRILKDTISGASGMKLKYLGIPAVAELACRCPHSICGGRLCLKSLDCSRLESVVLKRKPRPRKTNWDRADLSSC